MVASGTPVTIAVVGLGAIGGIAAATLATLGRHHVTVCVRSPIDRLAVQRPEDHVDVPVRALTDPAEAEPVDWVVLATKAHQTEAALPWLRRLVGPHTRVAAFQNGLGHADRLQPVMDADRVVPAIVYYNGERFAPDRMRFRRAGPHDLVLRDDPNGRALAGLLEGSPMRIVLDPDYHTLAWRKLLLNAVANPVTALTVQRQAVFRRPDIAALCLSVLEEAAAVGRADGAALGLDEPARVMDTLLTFPPEAGTSMYFDRLAGNPLEIEALTGAIVAAGARHGVPTPLNAAMLALLRAVSDAIG